MSFKNPKTYNAKLQWLKVYDRNPDYIPLVDKYEVKKIVGEKIGEEHIIKTYGVWDSFDEINFDGLPEQFVLKCTHDSGSVSICKDKSSFDFDKAKEKLERALKFDVFNKNYCDLSVENKKKYQAEILVKTCIPSKYILNL